MIGYCTSPRFVEHDTGPHHPERPDRIRAIESAVRAADLKLLELNPSPADEKWIRLIHAPQMIERVRRICDAGGGVLDQGDTVVSSHSFAVALLAIGAVLRCCDAVMSGEVTRAFAAVRPPGHHAEPDRPMGFCLFNNIAVAARYLQKHHAVERVAIVDFDVHHGNGTQAAFESDPSVLFISLHQHPATLYPGSGYEHEIGEGTGRGYTLNIPMNPGADDEDYRRAFDDRVLPRLDEFRPEALLISAGFDAHADDPLAQINLSDETFGQMTQLLLSVAAVHCSGRIVSTLEGGYNLAALGRSVVRHMIGLAGIDE